MPLKIDFRSCVIFIVACMIWITENMAMAGTGTEIFVGAATVNITPEGSVALAGQMEMRIAHEVKSPLTATAIALESRRESKTIDQAIIVSCDLIGIPGGMVERLRQGLKDRLPDLDVTKIFLNATHTHTAPVLVDDLYDIPEKGVMTPSDYIKFLTNSLSDLIIRAWTARKPGAVSWGLGHAVVAQNRRAVYADGHAEMYGRTDVPQFRYIEGYEDHYVNALFFWDLDRKLLAVAINVACPTQEVENNSTIDADFWHEVREKLRQRYSKDLLVLAWLGAAGDQSPHLMYQKEAEERMIKLRGLTRLQEIARRICQAVDDAYEVAKDDIHTDVLLAHKVELIKLPVRTVTREELERAKDNVERLSKDPRNRREMLWHQDVVNRYQQQKTNSDYDMELHVIRLGDVAIFTNPFELFTDYGIQIKARSRALQTFVIQLTGSGTYLPTEKAVRGGGYSAIVQSNRVGPDGGQILVDKTVESINSLWTESHP